MEKALGNIDPARAEARKQEGKALTLKELAVVAGYSYSTVRKFANEAGFPVLGGGVFWGDFVIWRRRYLGLISQPSSAEHRPRSTAGKSGSQVLRHG